MGRTVAVLIWVVVVAAACSSAEMAPQSASTSTVGTTVMTSMPPTVVLPTTEAPQTTSEAPSTAATTSSPTTTSSTSTTAPDSPDDRLVLAADGFGVVSFGDHVDGVMAVLLDRLGAPTNDDVYESPFAVPGGWDGDYRGPAACHVATGGYSCFDYLRLVWWADAYLLAVFSDLEVDTTTAPGEQDHRAQVQPSFRGYHYGGGDENQLLYTTEGITVGSPIADLLALGDRVSFYWNPCGSVVEFSINGSPAASESFMWGSLGDHDFETFEATDQPNPNATVQSFRAGSGDSC